MSSLDPYTAKAESHDASPDEKVKGLKQILKDTKTGMLVTRASDGALHSRAMSPSYAHDAEKTLKLYFVANNSSYKFSEIENDAHVNVSFYSPSNTNWVSYSGKARISQDRELIKKHWSTYVSAWFGDLHDGVHKGGPEDPRVSIIIVDPEEIRYWLETESTIARGIDVAVSAVTGHTATPGELRTLSRAEIQLFDGVHSA